MSHIKYIPVSPHSDEFLGIEYKLQIHLGTGELSEFHAWTVCNPHVTVNFERNCQVRGLDLMQQAEAETHTRDNGIEDHSHDAGGGGAAGGVRQAHEGERPQQAYAKRRGAGGETVRGCRREGFTHTLHTDTSTPTHRHHKRRATRYCCSHVRPVSHYACIVHHAAVQGETKGCREGGGECGGRMT